MWYWLDPDAGGAMASDAIIEAPNGKRYIAAPSGRIYQGSWAKLDDRWYLTAAGGAIRTGWAEDGGAWYWLDPDADGAMVAGSAVSINDVLYRFSSSGALAGKLISKTGWNQDGTDWYYSFDGKWPATGWLQYWGSWYYLDPNADGRMRTGHVIVDGLEYWLNTPDGDMAANRWVRLQDGSQAFAGDDGAFIARYSVDEVYSDMSGLLLSGWQCFGNKWYFIGSDGHAQTGWLKEGDKWYWFNDGGAMATGRKTIDGKVYLFSASGHMTKTGWQNPANYPQVSSETVKLPSYATGYHTYVTPSRISVNATREQCIDAFIARAYEYLGTRYAEPWAREPGNAIDCSGLVLQCLYATGMDLEHAAGSSKVGGYNPYNHYWVPQQTYNSMRWYENNTFKPVSLSEIRRGDIVFYTGHVAIYIGGGQIIHAGVYRVEVNSLYFNGRTPIGAQRPYV